MNMQKWFNDQKIQPVQDRRDGMEYFQHYNLFTETDLIECLEELEKQIKNK